MNSELPCSQGKIQREDVEVKYSMVFLKEIFKIMFCKKKIEKIITVHVHKKIHEYHFIEFFTYFNTLII